MYAWLSHPVTGTAGDSPAPDAAAGWARATVAAQAAAGGWLVLLQFAAVSIDDRGLLLGDALFETMRILHGRAPLLNRHLRRLHEGLDLLAIPRPDYDLAAALSALLTANNLKLTRIWEQALAGR